MIEYLAQAEIRDRLAAASDEPNRIYWRNRLVTLESVAGLLDTVRDAHGRGLGFASVTMNQIEASLDELRRILAEPAPGCAATGCGGAG